MAEQDEGANLYPHVGFHFKVEFHKMEGKEQLQLHQASFQEVSGLTAQLNIEEVKEGGENSYSHRLPAPAKFGNLVLKRGLMDDDDLVTWIRNAIDNFEFEPLHVFVKLLNSKTEPLQTWQFEAAFPIKWAVSGFNSTQNAVVVESVELAYKKFKVVTK